MPRTQQIARLVLAAIVLVSLVGCSQRGAEPNAFVPRAFARILPPRANGPEFELRGVLRDEHGAPLRNHALVISYDAPGVGEIVGRLRTDEYGRYGVRMVFPRSQAGSPAFIAFGFGDSYRGGGGGLALAVPGATGTAANGLKSIRGGDGVYRLMRDLQPGYIGPGIVYPMWDSLLRQTRRSRLGHGAAPGPRSERGREIGPDSSRTPQ